VTRPKRIMVMYGTRPEAIKLAPLISSIDASPHLTAIPVVTGQHREMLDQVNDLFDIEPHHDFDLMVHGASLNELAVRAHEAAGVCLRDVRPDAVVVQGDTSTAFMCSLAAFYEQIPVVHLEAGLRSHDIDTPFPEEANRQLTSRIARLHLAPTATSRDNLLAEGVAPASIAVTGNTVIDALHTSLARPLGNMAGEVAAALGDSAPLVLVTAHRRESWGDPMREAMAAVRDVAVRRPDVRWLIPMHRNPVVRSVISDALGDLGSVSLVEPLDYHTFCHAMSAADVVLTDSGGVQEEAPSLGKPVLVMRDNTERPEAVDAGTVRLVGTSRESVRGALEELLTSSEARAAMARAVNPYGDGRASTRCVAAIEHHFGLSERLPDFVPESASL
jgi:UDP-N-acetylglucosamine 2-epimerase (non-hydrolysing)